MSELDKISHEKALSTRKMLAGTGVAVAAAATAGPQFAARVNDGCSHCPIRPSCPAHARETS